MALKVKVKINIVSAYIIFLKNKYIVILTCSFFLSERDFNKKVNYFFINYLPETGFEPITESYKDSILQIKLLRLN